MPPPDPCIRVNELIREINIANRDIDKLLKEMEALSLGTPKLVRVMRAVQKLAVLLDKVPPIVWFVLYKFVRCHNEELAKLAVAELKLLVEVLKAHADVLVDAVEDPTQRDQAAEWAKRLSDELNGWKDDRAKDDAVAALAALKNFLIRVSPWILASLVEAFADDIAKAVENGVNLDKLNVEKMVKKFLIKQIAQRTVQVALGKAVAKKAAPFIGHALTGWELLVELAGGAQRADLEAYLDQLFVALVVLLDKCGWGWPQYLEKGKEDENVYMHDVRDDKGRRVLLGATVELRPFVRCATVMNGKVTWGKPCPVAFDSGRPFPSLSLKYKLDEKSAFYDPKQLRWALKAKVLKTSVDLSPCVKGAKYCYAYVEIDITYADGRRRVTSGIVGAKVF